MILKFYCNVKKPLNLPNFELLAQIMEHFQIHGFLTMIYILERVHLVYMMFYLVYENKRSVSFT